RILDRHQLIQTAARNHEAAHVLREVARESQDLRGERHQTPRSRIARIEACGADALRIDPLAVPPLHGAREPVDLALIVAQGLANIPQRAARAITDDGGRQGRALAAILAIDILDHLFTALVLEIHVDIRRLVALLGNEALEQHRHARGIHFGDLQAITDHGVGRRAPALTENVLRAGILNDI